MTRREDTAFDNTDDVLTWLADLVECAMTADAARVVAKRIAR